MAAFCRQCSIEVWGDDLGDFALAADAPQRGMLKEGEGWLVLCEGCGTTCVDDDGVCIDANCLRKHGSTVLWTNDRA